jgi:hypothetical protein
MVTIGDKAGEWGPCPSLQPAPRRVQQADFLSQQYQERANNQQGFHLFGPIVPYSGKRRFACIFDKSVDNKIAIKYITYRNLHFLM